MSHFTPDKLAIIFGVLFGFSEGLSFIPAIRANGIFQLIFGIIKRLAGK